MPQFDCRLVTEDGTVMERIIEAESKYEIYESAEGRNEMVLSVKDHKEPFDLTAYMDRFRSVKPQELENFTSQLSIMLNAGIPLIGSLQSLVDQAESETMRKVIADLVERVNSGLSFSQALEKYPRVFNTMYVNMIRAGETAGVLDTILVRLGAFIMNDIEVTRNIKSALRYPTIVFIALMSAFIGAIVFIIPRFAKMFEAQDIPLPLPTKIMIGLSSVVTNYWLFMLVGLVGLVAGSIYYIRTPAGAYQFDYVKLKIPVFKEIIIKSTISRFAHMLETLSQGGIQIIRALETCEETVGNMVIGKGIREAREKVSEGVSLAAALGENKWFPPMTVKMISVGEESGALDKMLANIAHQYDTDVDSRIQRLSAAIEPLMTVMMGGFLLLIALGIFLPMWNMYSTMAQ